MLTVAIQAGGRSSRMGQDKGLKPFLGRPLIQRVVERLTPIADEIIITTNHPHDYAFLDLPLFADLIPDRGALGGLYTALVSATHPILAVVACDMPFASERLLGDAAQIMVQEEADVVIPKSDKGFEPLHAVYRRSTCIPAVKTAIDSDVWKMIAWFPQVKVRTLTSEEISRFDPSGLAFSNVNTPEEFAEAEMRAGKQ